MKPSFRTFKSVAFELPVCVQFSAFSDCCKNISKIYNKKSIKIYWDHLNVYLVSLTEKNNTKNCKFLQSSFRKDYFGDGKKNMVFFKLKILSLSLSKYHLRSVLCTDLQSMWLLWEEGRGFDLGAVTEWIMLTPLSIRSKGDSLH